MSLAVSSSAPRGRIAPFSDQSVRRRRDAYPAHRTRGHVVRTSSSQDVTEPVAAAPARWTEEEKRQKQREHRKRNRQRNAQAVNDKVEGLIADFRALNPLDAPEGEQWADIYRTTPEAMDVAWETLPPKVDPFGTNKKGGESRGIRKRNQVMTFLTHLREFLDEESEESKCIVDFGCGTGNVLMTCAAMFPKHKFIGVDLNKTSVQILQKRIVESGLTNVSARVGLIEECKEMGADIALALHVCGEATDFVMNQAIEHRIPFIIAPCCVGKLQEGGMRSLNRMRNDLIQLEKKHIDRPRSTLMKSAGFDFETYMSAATLADWSGHQGVDPTDPDELLGMLPRKAKSSIEADRAEYAREKNYDVRLFKMRSQSGIRDDVIVGVPL